MIIILTINRVRVAKSPKTFSVTTMDLDNGESTVRTADGTLTRDRIAVKKQLEITFPTMNASQMSSVLNSMSGVFFPVTYPDPQAGGNVTKTFYAGNRSSPAALKKNDILYWGEMSVTLIER